MRTNIEIDDELLAKAMAARGLKTKKAAVEAGLRALVDESVRRERVRLFDELKGVGWIGDLDEMRRS